MGVSTGHRISFSLINCGLCCHGSALVRAVTDAFCLPVQSRPAPENKSTACWGSRRAARRKAALLTVLMWLTGSFLVRKHQRSYFESGNRRNGEMFKMPRCRDKFVSSDRFCEVSRLVTRNLSRRCLRRPLIGCLNMARWMPLPHFSM